MESTDQGENGRQLNDTRGARNEENVGHGGRRLARVDDGYNMSLSSSGEGKLEEARRESNGGEG